MQIKGVIYRRATKQKGCFIFLIRALALFTILQQGLGLSLT